eukprot:11523013-Ditylum_brightwellii.AAC.1
MALQQPLKMTMQLTWMMMIISPSPSILLQKRAPQSPWNQPFTPSITPPTRHVLSTFCTPSLITRPIFRNL